ncbi:DUF7693 family protein [Pseudomonas frederiksbergensis]|uniref:DUF7693 family protein n=1 Tax=Pseudomonas frederiksbergensis TaxID=104087 RepID=UPI003D24F86F
MVTLKINALEKEANLNVTFPLAAREVYRVLTDVALGKRIMMRSSIQSWKEIYHGLMPVEIEGWLLWRPIVGCAAFESSRRLP